ncbi:hypothetical protein M405DRAFT_846549 [Rhizopogon salebrosus TDB-379]|nr:hypothetical protein M405DRAFT_846549 [Rhizopogon salebrosus TDB-379]
MTERHLELSWWLSSSCGSTASTSFNFSVADIGRGIGSTTMIFARVLRGTIERRESMSNNTGGLENSMEDSNLALCKSWSNRPSPQGELSAQQHMSCFKFISLKIPPTDRGFLLLPALQIASFH